MREAYANARRLARDNGDGEPLIALIPYAKFLGVKVLMTDGHTRSIMPFQPKLIGNSMLPALHGGVTAAFMENAALLHLLIHLDERRVPKSIDFSLDYLKPARAEDCHAECTVSRAGLRIAQVQVRCWQKSAEEPIAMGRGHFLLTEPE